MVADFLPMDMLPTAPTFVYPIDLRVCFGCAIFQIHCHIICIINHILRNLTYHKECPVNRKYEKCSNNRLLLKQNKKKVLM